MAKEFNRSKYEKLFKTEWAVAVFLEQREDKLEGWEKILKTWWTKKIDWKDLADRVFSAYIRLKNADSKMRCRCVTCGKVMNWKDIQNGHYRSRGCNKYRFSEINCHPQCKGCNVMLSWNYRNYHIYMINRYWEEIERKLWEDKESVKYKQGWYEDHIRLWWEFIEWVLYWGKTKKRDE